MSLTLKQVRLLKEKSQHDLAEMLGVHVQTYRKLEENPNLVTIGQAKKLAKYLGISYDEIFFDN
jgi:transcriptional regulator with XRE-family HTH domain